MTFRWLTKEWERFQNDPADNIYAHPVDNHLLHWRGEIIGPSGTPFEGGLFLVDIVCSNEYPFKPPQCQMLTKSTVENRTHSHWCDQGCHLFRFSRKISAFSPFFRSFPAVPLFSAFSFFLLFCMNNCIFLLKISIEENLILFNKWLPLAHIVILHILKL